MLPSALSRSDWFSLGSCWAFSFQPLLPSDHRPDVAAYTPDRTSTRQTKCDARLLPASEPDRVRSGISSTTRFSRLRQGLIVLRGFLRGQSGRSAHRADRYQRDIERVRGLCFIGIQYMHNKDLRFLSRYPSRFERCLGGGSTKHGVFFELFFNALYGFGVSGFPFTAFFKALSVLSTFRQHVA